MTLVKTGTPIIDLSGSFGGVYFHRDQTGLHCCAQPRKIYRRTPAQAAQRRAFSAARAFSTDNRVVSFNIYRFLNGLPMAYPPPDYQIPHLQGP